MNDHPVINPRVRPQYNKKTGYLVYLAQMKAQGLSFNDAILQWGNLSGHDRITWNNTAKAM